jgi:hypothetical protein
MFLKSKNPESLIQLSIVTESHATIHIRITTQKKEILHILHKTRHVYRSLISVTITGHSIIPLRHLYEKYEGLIFGA